MTTPKKPTNLEDENFLTSIIYERFLGSGGYGIVLQATSDSKVTPTTAIKFLFPTEADEKEQKQILRESTIMAPLPKHSNVVRIIKAVNKNLTELEVKTIFTDAILPNDAQQKRDVYVGRAVKFKTILSVCIQMELCGENLRKWLNEYESRCDIAIQRQQMIITKNLIAGLTHLHENNIIHRDLKPENIMFSSAGYRLPAKIGDFGQSRNMPSEEFLTLTSNVGTITYKAPEILFGSKNYNFQADMFSLGLIIWEVVQFVTRSDINRLVYDADDSLVNDHELMGGVKEVIVKLTKKSPENRLKNLKDLDEFIDSLELGIKKTFCISNTQNMHAKNYVELDLCLEYANCGSVIELDQGIFLGPFVLNQHNVSIRGVQGTVIECNNSICFQILGNNCNISNVQIVTKGSVGIEVKGSGNIIKNVDFTCRNCIVVEGNENSLEDLNISNSNTGIIIKGCKNAINNVSLVNIEECGIMVASDSNGNTVKNICSSNVTFGIAVQGSDNKLSGIILTKNSVADNFRGVELSSSGSNNTVQSLICEGYLVDKKDWGLQSSSNNSMIKESKCGPVCVTGSNNTLTNVVCGELTSVESKVAGLNLIKCTGIKIELKTLLGNVSLIECEYLENQQSLNHKEDVEVNIDNIVPVAALEQVVRNGKELTECLKNVESGCSIRLVAGVYTSPFVLRQNNVKILGEGNETVIESSDQLHDDNNSACLQIVGNGCGISKVQIRNNKLGHGIELTGSGNTIENVDFKSYNSGRDRRYSVQVNGDKNKLKHLKIDKGDNGIKLKGCGNIVEQIELRDVRSGIEVHDDSNGNYISNININSLSLGRGIDISGSHNDVYDVDLKNCGIGVSLGGSHNSVVNFESSGSSYSSLKINWDLKIYSKDSFVLNTRCGSILVGADNVKLTKVDCEKVISILESAEGIRMSKCNAKELAACENVTLTEIECKFETRSNRRLE